MCSSDLWQESLKQTLLECDEINATTFAERLRIPHDKLSAFLTKFQHPFSIGFCDRILAKTDTTPTSGTQRWAVIERPTGWWKHTGYQIANICPVIAKIIQTDTGKKIYSGTITTDDGEVYAFSDCADKIEQMGLLKYSSAVLIPHKKLVF